MQHMQFPTNSRSEAEPEDILNKPLVTCSYGWKRTCVLYSNRIDVDGTIYALDDLVHVRAIHRTVLSIPSVRLELRFRKEDVILRGIAAVENAKSIVSYLDTYCNDTTRVTSRLRWSRDRQASKPIPTSIPTTLTTERLETVSSSVRPLSRTSSPVERTIQEYSQATTAPIEAPSWLQDLEQHVVYTREQRPTKTNRSIRKYGFDVQELVQQAEADTLPSVAVPLRLLPQEIAHYCTDATLSSETPVTAQDQQTRFTYTTTDHGRLILTNKRMIYIGRTGQIILDYARLTHVSRLRNAIVFSADHWSKRYVFEMCRPLECALYLDNILRQFQHQTAQNAGHTTQQPAYKPTLQHTYSARTTRPRHAAYNRQATNIRPSKQVVELEDIETLPLSLLNRPVEIAESKTTVGI